LQKPACSLEFERRAVAKGNSWGLRILRLGEGTAWQKYSHGTAGVGDGLTSRLSATVRLTWGVTLEKPIPQLNTI